jgi:dTDP-4-amino-4,6-dideoxygalactose transaminase
MKVAVPAHTFIATWLSIINTGCEAIGVDITTTGVMDLASLENLLKSENIDAVVPVHMHGQAVDMLRLDNLKTEYGFKVIEDASQAHGLDFNGRKIGSFGDISVFSLYPTKNLGALGDGGIVTTNEDKIAKNIRSMRNYGANLQDKHYHEILGINSRLDSIQAAICDFHLNYLDSWNVKRRELAKIYFSYLPKANTPQFGLDSIFHHFTLQCANRDKVKNELNDLGISTEIHYPRLAANEIKEILQKGQANFPHAEKYSKEILSLPLHQFHTEDEIEYVASRVKKILKVNPG